MRFVILLFLIVFAWVSETHANFTSWLEKQAEKHPDETRQLIFSDVNKGDIAAFLNQNTAHGENISLTDDYPSANSTQGHFSVLFEGEGNALVIEKWTDLGFSDRVSMGVWIKPDFSMFQESRETRFVVSKSASTEAGFFITITAEYGIGVGLVTKDGIAVVRAERVLEQYRWHHIGWSWDGESLKVFIDGEPYGDPVKISGEAKDYAASALTFGRPASLEGYYYRGLIGGFILYPEAYEAENTP